MINSPLFTIPWVPKQETALTVVWMNEWICAHSSFTESNWAPNLERTKKRLATLRKRSSANNKSNNILAGFTYSQVSHSTCTWGARYFGLCYEPDGRGKHGPEPGIDTRPDNHKNMEHVPSERINATLLNFDWIFLCVPPGYHRLMTELFFLCVY